jgi:predicted ATPase
MGQVAVVPDSLSGLPAELTAFVGRRHDRGEVRRLLSQSRLVTLTGFGGVGKTRLALRLASELSRAYSDGVWFVPLGELSDSALITETIAAAFGIHDQARRVGLPKLAEYLRQRELLLVLDNCEHLIDNCAVVVDTLLRVAPRLRILATSREALRVDGEAVWRVAPLSAPASAEDPGSLNEYEAVRLFVERAGKAVPDFAITEENRSAVAEICGQLDGIPLALELAAVRLRAMSPAELLDGLRNHWDLLSIARRSAPDRHRTMTACLDWSHALCSPAERDMWARLSVFAGGADMEGVQYVAAAPGSSLTPQHVTQLVQSLVDKSILTFELQDGQARYRMLEVLRRFGFSHLEGAEELKAVRRRHRDWCADLVKRADTDFMSPVQMSSLRQLRREESNLRLALQYCYTEPGEAAVGVELVSQLRNFHVAYGLFSEGRLWLNRLLPLVPAPTMTRLHGLRTACWLAVMQGDRKVGAALLAEARELAVELGGTAVALVDQTAGLHEMFSGNFSASAAGFERALEGFRAVGSIRDQAETHTLLGLSYGFAGELERAADSHEASLDLCGLAGESLHRSYSQWHLGLVAWAGGDPSRAAELEKQSLQLKRDMEDRLGVALCFEALAWIEADDDPRRAGRLLGAADALWKRMGTSLSTLPGLFHAHEKSESKVCGSLGERQFLQALAEGASMSWETAIAYALNERPTGRAGDDTATYALPELTRREREVAVLIAEGLTNKEIASRLIISTRTAETHVENILTKLGFTSRTQIAALIAAERGKAR